MRGTVSQHRVVSHAHRVNCKSVTIAEARAEERERDQTNLNPVRGERAKIGATFWGLRKEEAHNLLDVQKALSQLLATTADLEF